MKLKSEHFFVSFDYPQVKSNMAQVSLLHHHFGAVWKISDDYPKYGGKWAFNRQGLAFKLNCHEIFPQDSIEQILQILEGWYQTLTIPIDFK